MRWLGFLISACAGLCQLGWGALPDLTRARVLRGVSVRLWRLSAAVSALATEYETWARQLERDVALRAAERLEVFPDLGPGFG
jgi:hypothetical protein